MVVPQNNHPAAPAVRWQDLRVLSPWEKIVENGTATFLLLLSWLLAAMGFYLLSVPLSVIFFMLAITQVHNTFHLNLGISKKWGDRILLLMSPLIFAAGHAMKYNHLRHHRFFLCEEDEEGKCAKKGMAGALLYAPVFLFRAHAGALRSGDKFIRSHTVVELLSIAIFTFCAYWFSIHFLKIHILLMIAGQISAPLFAIWALHHEAPAHQLANKPTRLYKNFITRDLYYHEEHHRFPRVPSLHLGELEKRMKNKPCDEKHQNEI